MTAATAIRVHQAAGSLTVYFVALLDPHRQVVRRLSGETTNPDDARAFLRWARRRHPGAQLVRDLLVREVVA